MDWIQCKEEEEWRMLREKEREGKKKTKNVGKEE